MKVAFIGDSFCSGNQDYSWTTIVANNLSAEIICLGKGGMSVGQAYFDLMEHLDAADIYFMFYTDSRRLFNNQQYPLNSSSCFEFERCDLKGMKSHNGSHYPDAKIWNAGLQYFKYIYHPQYDDLVHELIVKKCDEILTEHMLSNPHKKVYHFHCFPSNLNSYKFKSGPCSVESMINFITRHGMKLTDDTENHMSVELNAAFANNITMLMNTEIFKWFGLP